MTGRRGDVESCHRLYRVSAGCYHCYAATLARRLKAMGNPRYQLDGPDGPGFGVTLHPDRLTEPLSWRKPRRVFVNSMSDLSVGVDDWAQRCVPVSLQLRDGGRRHFSVRQMSRTESPPRSTEPLIHFPPRQLRRGHCTRWSDGQVAPLLPLSSGMRDLQFGQVALADAPAVVAVDEVGDAVEQAASGLGRQRE